MSKKTVDRRVQKTRKLLHEALISLILEKNYESIVVQEILDRANVGRSTFYTHFRDKDELLIMGFSPLREILHNAQMTTPAAATTVPANSYEKVIGFSSAMFEHVYEYRKVWRALVASSAGIIVRQHFQEMISDLIRHQFKIEFHKRKRAGSKIPFELFVHFLASTFLSVMSWWLDSKKPLAPASINDIYRALVTPSLKSAFE